MEDNKSFKTNETNGINNSNPKKIELLGLPKVELDNLLKDLGLPAFRSNQIWHWIYRAGLTSFVKMTNLSKNLRNELQSKFSISRPLVSKQMISEDGTVKWLFKLFDGNEIETVWIPESDRGTLCVSSQVGCTLTCKFCHTGTQKLVRNLNSEEILAQVVFAMDYINDWPAAKENRRLTNIVLMGMGEPLFNYKNVKDALEIIMNHSGISISRRRITLSTSGIVPEIHKCGEELGVNLAISLHATNDLLRDELVPINKKYNIQTLLNAVRSYPTLSNARRVTWEYVMLKGINDDIKDAKKLVKLIEGIPSKINLIPFNEWPCAPYECSEQNDIDRFARVIMDAGFASPIRTPRGRDVMAACGQLKSFSERKPFSLRKQKKLLEISN